MKLAVILEMSPLRFLDSAFVTDRDAIRANAAARRAVLGVTDA